VYSLIQLTFSNNNSTFLWVSLLVSFSLVLFCLYQACFASKVSFLFQVFYVSLRFSFCLPGFLPLFKEVSKTSLICQHKIKVLLDFNDLNVSDFNLFYAFQCIIKFSHKTKVGDKSQISSIWLTEMVTGRHFSQSDAWDLRLISSCSFMILRTASKTGLFAKSMHRIFVTLIIYIIMVITLI
jgi:hypothetical protein